MSNEHYSLQLSSSSYGRREGRKSCQHFRRVLSQTHIIDANTVHAKSHISRLALMYRGHLGVRMRKIKLTKIQTQGILAYPN
jgi:hypothetical protein